MAVVKLKYTKDRGKIKAHIRYITHRPGKEGERQTRSLFDRDGQTGKEAAYRLIDSAKRGATFFKLVISPDPKTEDKNKDLDLWQISVKTLQALSERLGKPLSFVGVEHNDHTPNRHAHVVFALSGRLSKADIALLRSAATEASREQAQARTLLGETLAASWVARPVQAALVSRPGVWRARALQSFATVLRLCTRCLIVTRMTATGGALSCTRCGQAVSEQGIGVQLQEAGWGL